MTVLAEPRLTAAEWALHEYFAADRVEGEWFRASDRVMTAARILSIAGAHRR